MSEPIYKRYRMTRQEMQSMGKFVADVSHKTGCYVTYSDVIRAAVNVMLRNKKAVLESLDEADVVRVANSESTPGKQIEDALTLGLEGAIG